MKPKLKDEEVTTNYWAEGLPSKSPVWKIPAYSLWPLWTSGIRPTLYATGHSVLDHRDTRGMAAHEERSSWRWATIMSGDWLMGGSSPS